jgi:hypothetical protein
VTLFGNPLGDDFKGYHNRSTHCHYNWATAKAAGLWDHTLGEQFWMERGNPDYGLSYLPVHIRAKETWCGATENIAEGLDGSLCSLWGNATTDKEEVRLGKERRTAGAKR